MVNKIDKSATSLLRRQRNLILYGIIGVLSLGIELALFYALNTVAHQNIPSSNAAAMMAGFFTSFTLNSLYNFQVKDKLLSRLIRFGIVTFCGYWICTGIILSLVEYAHLPAFLAKLLSLPAFFMFQYTLNKRYTFQPARSLQTDNEAS